MQITVVKVKANSWEAHATESTQVLPCPTALANSLLEKTNTEPSGVSLTAIASVDYDTASAIPYTLSALGACIVPQQPRDLAGIYEVHDIAVMGVSPLSNDGKFLITACSECKKSLGAGANQCEQHAAAGTEQRWMMSFEMADDAGDVQAIAYHDALANLQFLPSTNPDAKATQQMIRNFRSFPWS